MAWCETNGVHFLFGLAKNDRLIAEIKTELDQAAVQSRRTSKPARQLLRRPGYEIDVEKVLRACAKHGVAVEINANPWRLDLNWRWHKRALELGCMVSINPDAHSTSEIELTHWGVEMARKGSVPKERVLNCLDLRQLLTCLTRKRSDTSAPRRAG
jgi:DNA polymerase (family X)